MTGNSGLPYFAIELQPGVPIPPVYRRIELQPAYPVNWTRYERTVNALIVIYGFTQGTDVKFEVGVEYKDTNPSRVGSASFWFDDVELIVLSRYWGLLGTSDSGQDVMAQLFWGAQVSLYVGIVATFFGVAVGLLLGLGAGYFGGGIDELTMRVTDFFIIMPALPIMMILSALLRPTLGVTVFVIAIFAWPGPARIIRSQVLVEKEKAYIEAARASGAGDIYLVFRHILPNVLTLVFVQIATGVSGAILSEAGLAFLGLTPQNLVSWGRMLQAASQTAAMTTGAWWFVIPPGVCIALLSMGFVFIGYAVDKALNPRLRKL
jgi:peptide/nickel transport system permease protein